jgi:hypothetical protein
MEQGNCAKLKQAYYDRLYTELSGKTLTDKSKEYSRDIVTILKEVFNKTVDFTVASSVGKHIAKRYRLKYNKDPEKYMKFVNGNNRPIFVIPKKKKNIYNIGFLTFFYKNEGTNAVTKRNPLKFSTSYN